MLARLEELLDPDAGKKKQAHVLEIDGVGPIAAAPLHTTSPYEAGGPSRVVEEAAGPPTKRVVQGTLGEWRTLGPTDLPRVGMAPLPWAHCRRCGRACPSRGRQGSGRVWASAPSLGRVLRRHHSIVCL